MCEVCAGTHFISIYTYKIILKKQLTIMSNVVRLKVSNSVRLNMLNNVRHNGVTENDT